MYCKLFASLYQGTLRGRSHEILVFTNLLANADAAGFVDKHFRAIAEEVGLSQDEVKAAIQVLESPDLESRSPEASGARLVKMDSHRAWGWRIVNYIKYRQIRSEEDRREQNRAAQERFRNKSNNSKPPSAEVSRGKPESAQAEAEAEEKKMPTALDFPDFIQVWQNWLAYKKQSRKKLTPMTETKQLELCVKIGKESAIKMINQSIEKGWSGLFETNQTPNTVKPTNKKPTHLDCI